MGSLAASTKRLILRVPANEDEQNYRALLLEPQVNRWLRPAPLPALSDPDPGLWLARDIDHWRRYGFGAWVLCDRDSGQFVGRCGCSHTTLGHEEAVELAWALLPSHWGAGLASEAASAALSHARELGLEEVVSFTIPANVASRRVMEKTGLQFDCEIERAGIVHLLYRLKLTQ